MADETQIDRAKSQSCVTVNIGKKQESMLWLEEFNFELRVQMELESRPYIYFSQDLTHMLVHDQNSFFATIYAHNGIKTSREVKWFVMYNIERYPVMLKGLTSCNFLFSPSM